MGIKLKNYIIPDLIFVYDQITEKNAILSDMVDKACGVVKYLPHDQILEAILKRESMASTDIGNRIAVPHCRLDSVSDIFIVLGISARGVVFEDNNKPVKLIFMVIGPQAQPEEYLFVLAQIARITADKNLILKLTSSRSSAEIYNELCVFL